MENVDYKKVLKVIRSNFNVRLQQKTNYGRNEMFHIVDAVLADSMADLLEDNIPNPKGVFVDPPITNTNIEKDTDLPW